MPRRADHPRWQVLAVLGAAESLAFMDGLIVSVALPAIQEAFGFTPGQLQWVINSYVVLMGGTLLVGGRLADRFGRRQALMAGLALFAGGALVGGLAPSGTALLVGRGTQGVGAGIMLSAALALVAAAFPEGTARQRALGVLAVLSGVAAVVGVVLGGLLTGLGGWRWVLLANVPPALVTALAARTVVAESRDAGAPGRFDLVGASTCTLALLLIVYGVVESEHGGLLRAAVMIPMGAGVVLAAAVVAFETRVAAPVIPVHALRDRRFVAANLAGALLPVGLGAVLFLGPQHLQVVLGRSAPRTGLWLVPMAAAVATVGPVASRAVERFGRRNVATAGFAAQVIGLVVLASLTRSGGSPVMWAAAGTTLVGLGAPLAYVPVTTAALHLAGSRSGVIAGMFNTSQHLGNAVALAVMAAVVGYLSAASRTGGDGLAGALRVAFLVTACMTAVGLPLTRGIQQADSS